MSFAEPFVKMTLSYDPTAAVEHLARRDRQLAKVMRRAGPFTLKPRRATTPYEALLRAIVGQQLSGKAAATIHGRVLALHAPAKRPTPELLHKLEDDALRAAGLSRNKLAAIRDLAQKSLDGTVPTLRMLRKLEDAAIVERLTQVRGVGVWTVEMLLMFTLGRPDVLPLADLGVRQGFMHTYGLKTMPTTAALAEHAERWRPYRSVGSWYMWRAVELHRANKNKQPS